ncbi:SIS domain-containing protein [Cryptosporangium phraense]|uniref:SIS domain-containing protein n=1 Tax=Cryptosporangium phraense TaxID=2593070 RepID=A0A545AEE2_9ACTN|nr:SIS domain-containing protein [Cryptosporangium phraense]TQS39630.1 SIS domain-containing protein [Cryptosporangium phraense]
MSGTIDAAPDAGAEATQREIWQQPRLWREVDAASAGAFLDPLLARPDLRIILTGAGTSAFAGGLLAPELTRSLRRRVDAVATTDLVSNPAAYLAEDLPTLLVSFARSGDSPESVAATALADQCLTEVHHLVVTCNADGQLAREHGTRANSHVLLMPAGSNDRSFAMTSSYTCMVLAAWSALAGPAPADALAEAGENVLKARDADAREIAARGYERIVYLGSGSLQSLARESALKVLELTAGDIVAYADSPLGFRHGPKSVLDAKTFAVVYLSDDPYTRRYDEDIALELRASLGVENVRVVAGRPSERLGSEGVWYVDGLDGASDVVLSLPFVLVAQMLALRFSLALGHTPDNPFPSGEVNRVVRGVTIYPAS